MKPVFSARLLHKNPHAWPWRLALCWMIVLLPLVGSAKSVTAAEVMEFAEEEVKERLALLDQSLLEHRLDDAVRRLIQYHLRYPNQTARNVGRAVAYFPIFEAELAAAGLPATLKYLPVIESALLPRALSRVGAEGLWQFMPYTAPEYGLRIDSLVDERLDAQLATQAAIRYLQSAHEYLGDWSLAIAAYNCGKGRANRAKRRSGGRNFWSARRHFPRETRNYVPAFIAAVYLTEFYAAHGIAPDLPSLDEQLLERMVVYEPLSFYRIAQVTDLSVEFIQQLNPAYLRGYLPGYRGGHNLLLPERVMPAVRTYLTRYGHLQDEPALPWASVLQLPPSGLSYQDDYHRILSFPTPGDSLESIAERLQLSVSQLSIWNNLSPLDTLTGDDAISYYRVANYRRLPERSAPAEIELLAANQTHLPESINTAQHELTARTIFLTLTKRQKPSQVLERYQNLDAKTFLLVNEIEDDGTLPAGTRLELGACSTVVNKP
ncbi:MAG: transglycosylase SLT domain-containing protein [Bacteroidota bacterium]